MQTVAIDHLSISKNLLYFYFHSRFRQNHATGKYRARAKGRGDRGDEPGRRTQGGRSGDAHRGAARPLRQDIILGALQPAAKLKLEKLSKSYGVSVNTLRESLSRLAADGLVVAEGQKGFAVLPVSIEDLREITEMRQLLECHALRQSIATPISIGRRGVVGAYHKLSKVEALVEARARAYGDAWERYNQEFHDALIANCRSRWLKLYHRAMYDHSQRYRMLSLKTKPFPRSQSAKEHRRFSTPRWRATSRPPSGCSPPIFSRARRWRDRSRAALPSASRATRLASFNGYYEDEWTIDNQSSLF